MKKQALFYPILLCLFLGTNAPLKASFTPITSETLDSLCSSTKTFQFDLFFLLEMLYKNRTYWQEIEYRPFGYFLEKGPLKWLQNQKDQKKEINTIITIINQEILYLATILGRLEDFITRLSQEKTISDEELKKHIKPLNLLISKSGYPYSTESSVDEDIQFFIKIVKNYKKDLIDNYTTIKKPGHFQRNWLAYSIATLCGIAGYNYYIKNQQLFTANIEKGITASKNFFSNYIKEPVKNSIDIIYGKEGADNEISEKIILEREKILRNEFENYYNNHSELTQKKIHKKVMTSLKNRQLPLDMQERADMEARNLTYNLVWYKGKIGNILYLKGGLLELMAYDRIKKVDRLMATNKLNFELLVALPATGILALCSYLSYKVGSKLYYFVFSKPERYYKSLKEALIKLESIFNTYQNTESLDYALRGQISYWIHTLYKSIEGVPFVYRNNFESDIKELTIINFTTFQKLSTIQRMFRAYPFLNI